MLPGEVLQDIQGWIEAPNARLLWIEGPAYPFSSSDLSMAGLKMCELALRSGVACISFFCTTSSSLSESASTSGEASLVSSFYSLICQLTHLASHRFEDKAVFFQGEFKLLDGSIASARPALRLLRALFELVDLPLICVIDGFQLLEIRSTESMVRHLAEYVGILRNQATDWKARVLFTASGNSQILGVLTDIRERIDANRMAQKRPGAPLRGGISLELLEVLD